MPPQERARGTISPLFPFSVCLNCRLI
ncbi:Eukaryotic aspartyl protease family protein [Zea mays]|uniref:Eukaryotic aspartyl protease family protein n=1 Tax=Zea mays TaxID=4577 RepID=A0A1D6QJ41_MAIZE|nr:Eukaryotic aspartyl protease family protein [Zea mays]